MATMGGGVVTRGLAACSDPAVGLTLQDATLAARPGVPAGTPPPGLTQLGLAPTRDGFLYVPPGHRPDTSAPLLVLLHGAGRSAAEWSSGPLPALVDDLGIIVVGPDSRGATWDLALDGGYGPDVRFIDECLAHVFGLCRIDPARIALGGFSDGGSYALSLGLANGDLFTSLLAFSPGFLRPPGRRGAPRIFVAHGTNDTIIPVTASRDTIVPALRRDGLDVEYLEFEGPHAVTVEVARQAFEWFAPAP